MSKLEAAMGPFSMAEYDNNPERFHRAMEASPLTEDDLELGLEIFVFDHRIDVVRWHGVIQAFSAEHSEMYGTTRYVELKSTGRHRAKVSYADMGIDPYFDTKYLKTMTYRLN